MTSLQLEEIRIDANQVTLVVHPTRRAAPCPLCGRRSQRVHSHYERRVADLPWSGRCVVLHIRVRRFRCSTPTCPRQTFAERLPQLGPPRCRRTAGQRRALEQIGGALGGAAGARLAQSLGLPASRATLLRLVRAAPCPEAPTPRVLGVDDWAWRRGQRYGSILVDLEQRRPVDLLPDRTAESLTAWLREHPGVEVISRDRGGAYAAGARQGAPDAVQVADRFHLLANVGEALERVLGSRRSALREAAAAVDRLTAESAAPDDALPDSSPGPEPARLTRVQRDQQARRERRLARYQAVVALHQQGLSQCAISGRLSLGRKTIRRYLRAESFPDWARPTARPTLLAPYEGYLRARWTAGCHNAATLWREIRQRGFTGGPVIVRRYVAGWRTHPARRGHVAQRAPAADAVAGAPARPPTRVLSPRQARWLLLGAEDALRPEEQTYRTQLLATCPEIREASQLTADFGRLVRTRDRPALRAWLAHADRSELPEFRAFAVGIRRDQPAVEAALSSDWSNGQTEGQINRLKCLKRQMYGR